MDDIDKHAGWRRGQFIDSRKYDHLPEEWKEAQRRIESCLVRPSASGNAICRTDHPAQAAWIAERLNAAARGQQ